MIGAVENSNISAVRFFNATNAFNKTNQVKSENQTPKEDLGVEIKDNSLLKNINVAEIKQFADSVGETNLSDEDIKYGLKYGRSVLIDYSA